MPLTAHTKEYEHCRFSVLRVDGGIHDKARQIKKDRAQEKELRDLNIPFFVSDNDFWKWEDPKTGRMFTPDPYRIDYKKIPARHLDYLVSIWNQTLDENLYKKYLEIKEIKDSRLI
jgi:hypothetical protein